MRRILMSMFLTMVLLTPSMAKADTGVSSNDLASVFNESASGNELVASALSLQEMEETEGAWGVPGAIVGGVAGAGGYAAYTWGNKSQWSWNSFAWNTGIGAASGFAFGPVGVGRTIAGWGIYSGGSYGYGRATRR